MLKTGVILAERYRLDEPIAAGGVGQVWRGTDLVLQRRVAVKVLRPEYADHPDTLSRFRAEARHAGSLAHPSIAQVYDFGDNPLEGPPYLVMELVDGPSLADVLVTEPVTPAYALEVLAKAATGLAAAHGAGLVHRDIKPGNILLGPDGQVKITDFGIAHAVGSAPITDPGLVMGTTQYLAPERIAGGSGSPAADLYSLGIVMHECLTGVPPYEGTPAEVMAGHLYVPLPPLPADTPSEVEDLVARLTAKDPGQRLSDAGELAALARMVRTAITPGGMPPQLEAPAISPVGGQPAPVSGGHRDPGILLDITDLPVPARRELPAAPEPAGFAEPAGFRELAGDGPAHDGDPAPAGAAPWEPADSSGPGNALVLRHASVVVDPDPTSADDMITGGHARKHVTGEVLESGRPRGLRRAALGIGVLVVAGGAGLTGVVASGVLHTSTVADRTSSHPSLSAVQPDTTPRTGRAPAPAKSAVGRHAAPHPSKNPKTSAPATTPAASKTPPASAATPPAPGTGPAAPNPQPSPSQSTPTCFLAILCP